MRAARSLMFVALLPLFAGCQLLESSPQAPSTAGLTRMQGELGMANGKLVFKPCQGNTLYAVHDSGGTSVMQEAATLAGSAGSKNTVVNCSRSMPGIAAVS